MYTKTLILILELAAYAAFPFNTVSSKMVLNWFYNLVGNPGNIVVPPLIKILS